jgi:hypothetical protein
MGQLVVAVLRGDQLSPVAWLVLVFRAASLMARPYAGCSIGRFAVQQRRSISALTMIPGYRFHQLRVNLRVLEVTESRLYPMCPYPIRS